MSWGDFFTPGPVLTRPSPADSDRFGLSVDRIVVPRSVAEPITEIRAAVAASTADVVILRFPAEHVRVGASLWGRGRDLLVADQLIYWRLRPGAGRRPAASTDLEVARLQAAELATPEGRTEVTALVDDLVADVFAGYGSHYLANPLFAPEAALAGYQEWARRSALGGGGLLLRSGGEPVALATTATEAGILEIELAGVRAAVQGRGLYAHLLAGVEDVAVETAAESLVISTQAHNTDVQRAWARYGWEPVGTFTTVHLIRPGLLQPS